MRNVCAHRSHACGAPDFTSPESAVINMLDNSFGKKVLHSRRGERHGMSIRAFIAVEIGEEVGRSWQGCNPI